MRNMRGMWLCMPPLVGGIEQGGKPQEKIKNIGKFGESSFVFFRAYLLRVQWFCSRPRPPLLLQEICLVSRTSFRKICKQDTSRSGNA